MNEKPLTWAALLKQAWTGVIHHQIHDSSKLSHVSRYATTSFGWGKIHRAPKGSNQASLYRPSTTYFKNDGVLCCQAESRSCCTPPFFGWEQCLLAVSDLAWNLLDVQHSILSYTFCNQVVLRIKVVFFIWQIEYTVPCGNEWTFLIIQ